jgi:uncharacterized protein YlxP (DUF503 family)
MIVAVGRVELELSDIHSLKDKRAIVRPLVQKLMNQFSVMAAEVDQLDTPDASTLGIVLCANEQAHANRVLSKALDWLENHQFNAHVADIETQFIPMG